MSTARDTIDADRALRSSMLRLRSRAPFFGTLALYARFVPNEHIPTAATDGQDVFYNPAFVVSLLPAHLDGLLVHEVLHAALGHVYRRGTRHPERWNQAADIVVNGLLFDAGLSLPDGALRDAGLERFSVEEVYAALAREGRDIEPVDADLMPGLGAGTPADGDGSDQDGATAKARNTRAQRQWAQATDRAASVARGRHAGNLPGGVERAFGLSQRPKLDWRALLWRFLARAPTDFATFDRRFIHQGLYLETLEAVSLRLVVGVDTSGSIDISSLDDFQAELLGVLRAYPGTQAWLFYVDTEAYGPYRIESGDEVPPPEGGGGTDFSPFFAAIETAGLADEATVAVYLTDGDGPFPAKPPDYPVLWIVTPGGVDEARFPFGDVVRMG